MVLSAMVQMKNTLSKFLDFEQSELNPDHANKSQFKETEFDNFEMSVCTPMSVG